MSLLARPHLGSAARLRVARLLVLLVLLVALSASLGGCTQSIAAAQATACEDVRWGGYDGDWRCAALAQRVISGTHRGCAVDADCVLVHPGASCREQSVARAHLAAYGGLPAACTHPAAGPCAPVTARCREGCCVTMH